MDVRRRDLILGAGGLFGLAAVARAGTGLNSTGFDDLIPLWKKAPGGGGPSGPVQISSNGAISNISVPSLEIYRPQRPNGMATLVAAGGGYKRIEMESEARPAARWLGAWHHSLRSPLPAAP